MRTLSSLTSLAVVILLLIPLPVLAASVTVSWRPSPDPDLAHYNLYYGTQSRVYGPPIDVGQATTYEVTGLQWGDTYYFAVTAVDTNQNESGYSPEAISTVKPRLAEVRPRRCQPGDLIDLIGKNFGAAQGESVVHIAKRSFGSGSPRIVLWSDTGIRIRIPGYQCKFFGDRDFRRRRVWVTVQGIDSEARRIRVNKPAECP
jgi:hypothetical protein